MFHKEGSSVMSKGKRAVDTPLRKSDRRELRDAAKKLFPGTIDEKFLSAIFLDGTLMARKIVHPSLGKVVLYFRSPETRGSSSSENDDEAQFQWPYTATAQCIWMTVDMGPKQLVHAPTLALLAVLPDYPAVLLQSHVVSKFICGGADCMRSGIQSIPAESTPDGIVCLKVPGNPQPFAVGRPTGGTCVTNIGPGNKGVGVGIWTSYGDDLWRCARPVKENSDGFVNPIGGSMFDDGNYGNVGFMDGNFVSPIVPAGDVEEETSDSLDESPLLSELAISDKESAPDDMKDGPGEVVNDSANMKGDQSNDSDENPHEALLHATVCKALVNIKDSDLPMTTANLYAQHVLPSRPPGSSIQLRSTRWKKFGPYLAEQAGRGLLEIKAQGDNPVGFLVAINRKHEDLRGIKKDKASEPQHSKRTAIVNLFVIPHHWVKLLRLDKDDVAALNATSDDRRGTGMLTAPEARAILEKYITQNDLLLTPIEAQLDGALTDALYKKQPDAPERLSRKDLTEKWTEKLEPAYAIVEMPGSHVRKVGRGAPPKVLVDISMRQGRKFITRVRGLEEFDIDPTSFCNDVTKRFACSGTIEIDPEGRAALKKGHVELVFQGRLERELQALLLGDERLTSHGGAKGSEYSLPKGAIDVKLQKGVASKKSKR